MSPSELESLVSPSSPDVTVIDVRLADDFDALHIPGARNNCVFEVTFEARMDEIAPELDGRIVVYGWDGVSQEAGMALEKLTRLGYSSLSLLDGGIEGWKEEGRELAKGAPIPEVPPLDGSFAIDLEESRVEWLGRNLLNKHWGTVDLKSGGLTFSNGALVGGSFEIAMDSLRCTDLEGTELHDVLIDHLRNDDFFDTDRFPVARYTITEARPGNPGTPGSENWEIIGDLSLKDVTRPLPIVASCGITESGMPAAQASFSFDRTAWNVRYGSGKLFKRLAGHLVNDLLEIQLRLVGKQ